MTDSKKTSSPVNLNPKPVPTVFREPSRNVPNGQKNSPVDSENSPVPTSEQPPAKKREDSEKHRTKGPTHASTVKVNEDLSTVDERNDTTRGKPPKIDKTQAEGGGGDPAVKRGTQMRPGDTTTLTLPVPPRETPKPGPVPDPKPHSPTEPSPMTERKVDIWAPLWLRSTFFISAMFLILASITFNVFQAVWPLAVQIFLSPNPWVMCGAGAGLIILLSFAFYYLGKAIFCIWRLRSHPQITISQVEVSSSQLTELASAKKNMSERLDELIKDSVWSKDLERLGMKEEQTRQLEKSIKSLTDRKRSIDANGWWSECQRNVLNPLDQLAKEKLSSTVKAVGLKTALSPWKAVDAIVVMHHSFRLARELCVIANLRPGRMATISIMLHVAINIYVASRAQEWTEYGGEVLTEVNSQIMGELGVEVSSSVLMDGIGGIMKKITPKVAEGLTNSLFVYRLGSRTWMLVRPVKIS